MSEPQAEIVLRGSVFAVERLTVQLRSGGRADRHIVRHPGAVCVMGILDDGRLVTIRNFRITTGRWLAEFCAGKLEAGEDPILAAHRELIEETGYRAQRVESLGSFYTSPGFTDELMHAFVATGLTACPSQLQEDERIEVVLRTLEEWVDLIRAGEVCDGKTMATFLRWQLAHSKRG
ncbi:MAG: NUDIX hydrolase [Phycisphaerales bacterium]|nr:NUDIX hydrolase [Phycisphaerales bacterium]